MKEQVPIGVHADHHNLKIGKNLSQLWDDRHVRFRECRRVRQQNVGLEISETLRNIRSECACADYFDITLFVQYAGKGFPKQSILSEQINVRLLFGHRNSLSQCVLDKSMQGRIPGRQKQSA